MVLHDKNETEDCFFSCFLLLEEWRIWSYYCETKSKQRQRNQKKKNRGNEEISVGVKVFAKRPRLRWHFVAVKSNL